MEHDRIADTLAGTTVFGRVQAASLRQLAAACTTRTYKRDQFLWYQGDPGDYLVVITSGLVKVTVTSVHGDEMVLVTLGAGDVVGELSVIDQGQRSASLVAVRPTEVVVVARSPLVALMQRSPELLDDLLCALGATVRRLTEQSTDLVFLDLAGRVAKLLVRSAAASRPEVGTHDRSDPPVFEMPLTQTELAQMLGASRPALNRVLQGFASRGFIRLDGRKVTVLDLAGLRRRADVPL